MKSILVFGDSQVWGRVPRAEPEGFRHPLEDRWPIQLEGLLGRDEVRVEANGLNGRRTVFEDPFRPYKNGSTYLDFLLHCHMPLDLVVLWLGTNDFQYIHHATELESAMGNARLIDIIQAWKGDPPVAPPPILVCAPPIVKKPAGWLVTQFRNAHTHSPKLPAALKAMCATKGVHFFDASQVAELDAADGVHLSAQSNLAIAHALAPEIQKILDLGDTT